MRAWWWLAIVAACGDNAEVGEGARDGSRIELRWFAFEDGTRQWEPQAGVRYTVNGPQSTETFYDRELGTTCTPALWLDGITRCVPSHEILEYKLFADAACTTRVTENPDRYELVADYDPKCGVRRLWHVYPIEKIVPTPEAIYVKQVGGACQPVSTSATEIGVLGEEVPPDRFATITTAISDDSDRMHVRFDESDDGMRVPIGLYDSLLGPAQLSWMYAIPNATGEWYYADASCSERVTRVEATCQPPVSAYWGQYSRVGEKVAVEKLYQQTSLGCEQSILVPSGDYYRIEPTGLPLADMVTTTDEVADRRVQLRHAYIGERPFRDRTLVDTALGIECMPYLFPDGEYRCAPDPYATFRDTSKFADAACQMPLELVWAPTYNATPKLLFEDRTELGGDLILREVGARYTATLYFADAVNGCLRHGTSAEYYAVGRNVEWDELARATLTRD